MKRKLLDIGDKDMRSEANWVSSEQQWLTVTKFSYRPILTLHKNDSLKLPRWVILQHNLSTMLF